MRTGAVSCSSCTPSVSPPGTHRTTCTTSALILTGLSVEPDGGQFEYKPWMHHTGHVKVMGFSSGNHSASKGEAVAMAYLRYLAHHPDTARHLATKLAVRFVSDDPPSSLVNRLAATYLHHGTQIVPVLRQLFASKEFSDSRGGKVRTPYEDFIATLRVLDVRPPHHGTDSIRDLQWMSGDVGQPPLAWHAPNGYADTAAAWSSTSATLGRWNTHMNLAGQWWPDKLNYTKLDSFVPKPTPKTYGRPHRRAGRSTQRPGVQRGAASSDSPSSPVASRATRSPRRTMCSSWRLPYLVALILDSSHQAER